MTYLMIVPPSRAGLVLALLLLSACSRTRPEIRPGPGPGETPPPREMAATEAPARDAFARYLDSRVLALPVAGVEVGRLRDSFTDPRDGGARTHHALDIMAPRGTPVLAADDGRILRMRSNTLGGITVYTSDPAGRVVYYYAHLDRYHPGRSEGTSIARGDTLGYVGTTGNAPPNVPHLHFQVLRVPDDGRWWVGEAVNPLPLLRASAARVAQAGRPMSAQPD